VGWWVGSESASFSGGGENAENKIDGQIDQFSLDKMIIVTLRLSPDTPRSTEEETVVRAVDSLIERCVLDMTRQSPNPYPSIL
jgi:hypothetical protein